MSCSDIDGTIASTIDGADFYFINPAGVLFGPNATLEVPGSFHVSTADELRFADGEVFSARDLEASRFSVAAPEAFGFLDRVADSIMLDRTELPVAPDRTVSLVGGDVIIDRGLTALRDSETGNGNVSLVAMSWPGTVAVADGRTSAAPQGGILVTDSEIDVSSAAGGGVVRIRAGELGVENSFIVAASEAAEPGPATTLIDIESARLHVNFAEIGSDAFGAGNAGEVRVRAGDLEISGGLIASGTFGAGNAGNVVVRAGHLKIRTGSPDFPTGITTSVELEVGAAPGQATGNAGTVTVEAKETTVSDLGIIASNSADAGNAGTVELTADRIIVLTGGQIGSGTGLQSTGAGGDVVVTRASPSPYPDKAGLPIRTLVTSFRAAFSPAPKAPRQMQATPERRP